MKFDHQVFTRWFRESSPYIQAHRGRTFVVCFGGEIIGDSAFRGLAQDLALLNSLGIRLVLVHGIRPQSEERLKKRNIKSNYKNGLRITDEIALLCVKEAAGIARVEIESVMSMGMTNSPMAGARVRIASGNFVTAKPLGVIDGTDFCHTGNIRRIDEKAIREKLDQHNVVLISPIGYSPTGEVFNLNAEMVATSVATTIKADKLILMMEQDDLRLEHGKNILQLTTQEAKDLLGVRPAFPIEIEQYLKAAIKACESGVGRAHLIHRKIDGALLLELFSREGIGTMVSLTPYDVLRNATISDIEGTMDLIDPLERNGVLVARKRENMEIEIETFSVMERDGLILGCAALHVFPEQKMAELACLALHPDYRGEGRGERLLDHLEAKAKAMGLENLFVLTTKTSHWFRERGFEKKDIQGLPIEKQLIYNYQRNSKVLIKKLSANGGRGEDTPG